MKDRKEAFFFLGIPGTAIAVALAWAFISWCSGDVNASVDDEGLHVGAPLVDENIGYDDIVSIEVREDMDFGKRTNGFGGS